MRVDAVLNLVTAPFRYKGPENEHTRFISIISLTWPQMALLCCQFIIGITDVWAAGRLGSSVQASIGLITQCQMMLMSVGMAAMSGTVATVSQSLGAGRLVRARRYVGLTLSAGIGLSVVVALTGYGLRDDFLRLIQTPPDIAEVAQVFLFATLWSLPGHYGMTLGGAVFRAAKQVMMPLYVGMLACGVNVVGDLGFGLGWWGFPAFGAAGIAWSTFAAVSLGASIFGVMLLRRKLITRESIPCWRWVRVGGPYLLKVALPALGTSLLWQSGYMVLYVITASLPVESVNALAGLTAGLRVEALLFMPAIAMNMTASVLVGHSLGAGNEMEARRVTLVVLTAGCALMTVVMLFLWPFRMELASLITPDPAVRVITVLYLTYNFLSTTFSVGSTILTGVFNGAGATVYPMRAFSVTIWCIRLPLAWFLAHVLFKDAEGIFLAMLASQVVQCSWLLWVFFRCNWARYAMRHHSPDSVVRVDNKG